MSGKEHTHTHKQDGSSQLGKLKQRNRNAEVHDQHFPPCV